VRAAVPFAGGRGGLGLRCRRVEKGAWLLLACLLACALEFIIRAYISFFLIDLACLRHRLLPLPAPPVHQSTSPPATPHTFPQLHTLLRHVVPAACPGLLRPAPASSGPVHAASAAGEFWPLLENLCMREKRSLLMLRARCTTSRDRRRRRKRRRRTVVAWLLGESCALFSDPPTH
jgi:hypothetical protein